jgi:uncharacterized protein
LPAWSQSRKDDSTWSENQWPIPIVHFEIGCRDRAKSERFFGDLFGWHMQQNGPASAIDTGQPAKDSRTHHVAEPRAVQHYTMFYVEVEDVQAYLDKAKALGGKTLVPPIKIPTGTFAWFADVDGNTIGLLKPEK